MVQKDLDGLFEEAADKYDPLKGWSTSAQPLAGLSVSDYRYMAEDLLPELDQRLAAFCDANKLSYVVIPHHDFHEQYEKGAVPFEAWYENYRKEHNLDKSADVLILSGVKPERSSEHKASTNAPDRTKDYLRGELLLLQGTTGRTKRASVQKFANVIDSLENGSAVARKNTLFSPHEHGYRDFKALWVIGDPEYIHMLAEVKVDHAAFQDAHRLTRRFMGTHRLADTALAAYYTTCAVQTHLDAKNTHAHIKKIDGIAKNLDGLAKGMYDTLYERAGFNRFLDSAVARSHRGIARDLLLKQAQAVVDHFPMFAQMIKDQMGSLGIEPQKLKVPEKTYI